LSILLLLPAAPPCLAEQDAPPPMTLPTGREPRRPTQNVKIDVTVRADDAAGTPQVVYQVSGVFGEGARQQVTTSREFFVSVPDAPAGNYRSSGVFLVAQPLVDGRTISVAFTLDVTLPPPAHRPDDRNLSPSVKQEATIAFESGKPVVVFRSEAPGNAPTVTVEMTATVLAPGGPSQPAR
jgi:hypothetical protein